MKKIQFTRLKLTTLLGIFALFTVAGCGINKQTQQIKALEKCTYKILSADQITVGGADIKRLVQTQDINLGSLPGLALGLLRKDIPLHGKLNMQISNPTSTDAAINEFEYKILVNNQEIATGFVNQLVDVRAGQNTVVPVDVNINVYQFVSNGKIMSDITRFLQGGTGSNEQKGLLTLKIKPSIRIGNSLVKYPGFITIDKEISSKILL